MPKTPFPVQPKSPLSLPRFLVNRNAYGHQAASRGIWEPSGTARTFHRFVFATLELRLTLAFLISQEDRSRGRASIVIDFLPTPNDPDEYPGLKPDGVGDLPEALPIIVLPISTMVFDRENIARKLLLYKPIQSAMGVEIIGGCAADKEEHGPEGEALAVLTQS